MIILKVDLICLIWTMSDNYYDIVHHVSIRNNGMLAMFNIPVAMAEIVPLQKYQYNIENSKYITYIKGAFRRQWRKGNSKMDCSITTVFGDTYKGKLHLHTPAVTGGSHKLTIESDEPMCYKNIHIQSDGVKQRFDMMEL